MKWLLGLALGCMLVTLVPDAPFAVGGSLDAGWMYGLNLAAAKGLVFGRDVAFTYGPWGHLLFPLPPALQTGGYVALVLGLLASVGASVGIVVWRLGRDAAWALAVLWVGGLLGYQIAMELPEFALVAAAMAALAWVRTGGPPAWAMGGLAMLTAVGFLTKGTHFVLGVGMMVCLAVVSRGRGWWGGLVLPLAMAAAFRGDIRSCAQYVWSIFELSAGYSESMTLAGPWPVYHLGAAAALMLLGGIAWMAGSLRTVWPGLLMGMPLAIVAFRHAFTRQDQHSDPVLIRLAVAASLALVLMPPGWGRRVMGLACVLATLQGAAFLRYSGSPVYARAVDHLMGSGVRQTLGLSAARIEREAYGQMPEWPDLVKRLTQGKTVEVVPFQTWRAAAERVDWRPRPVFQAYSAYTPGLDRWNAQFLRERGAPVIVHEGGVIDDRQLLWEDPASSLAMASWYRVAGRAEGQLVLERTASPRLAEPLPLFRTAARWGQDVALPEVEGLRIARVKIELHPVGRLYSLLVRTPAVNARVRMTNGYTVSRRVVFRNLENGVAADFFDNSLDAVAGFVEGDAAGLRAKVHMLAFDTGSAWAFRAEIPIEWRQVKRLRQEAVVVPPLGDPAWSGGEPAVWSGGGASRAASSGSASLLWPIAADAETVVIRVRADRPAVVALSWGDHGGPNRIETDLPVVGQWQDVYFQTSLAENWRRNRGSSLGLQIQTDPGSEVGVAGLWLLNRKPPQPSLKVQVWPESQP